MALKKIITSRRTEIESASRQHPVKTSERIRSKRSAGAQRLSAICAALTYEDEDDESDRTSCHDNLSQMDYEDESGAEGSVVESEDSVLWSLYNSIKNYKNSLGQALSEPFMRLPSKRWAANDIQPVSQSFFFFFFTSLCFWSINIPLI